MSGTNQASIRLSNRPFVEKTRLGRRIIGRPKPNSFPLRKVSIGIDLGGTNIKFGLVKDGKIIQRLTILTKAMEGPKSVITRIIKGINSLASLTPPCVVGIGVAGLIDHKRGIVHFSPNLPNWQDIPIKDWLCDEIKIPIFVGNDANAFVLGEYCFGAGKGKDSVFGITLGTGVGGGMILNGRLWLGENQAASEIGHTTINLSGPRCKCGNRGCLERYVGADYIVARTKRRLKTEKSEILKKFLEARQLTPKAIADAARQGDQLARSIIEETGNYIGVGLANVISLLDPTIIIIGGGVSGFGKLLLDSIQKTTNERIMNFPKRSIKIVLSKLKNDAGILGASQFAEFIR